MIATPVFKALRDGRFVRYDPEANAYEVVPREHVPPLRVLQLSEAGNKLPAGEDERQKHLATVLAMIKFQQAANATGDPEASKPYLDEIRARLKSLRMSWRQEQSASGKIKAVGEGEHQGRVLYGRDAEAALRNQAKGPAAPEPNLFEGFESAAPPPVQKSPPPEPAAKPRRKSRAKGSASDMAAAEAEAKARAEDILTNLFAGIHTDNDLHELADHLPWLSDESLNKAATQVVGAGAKPAAAEKTMDSVREALDEKDAAAAPPHALDTLAASHDNPDAIAATAEDLGVHEAINAAHRGEHGPAVKAAVERGSKWENHHGDLRKKHAAIGRALAEMKEANLPPDAKIVNRIDLNASPEEKVQQLVKLTAENKPKVDAYLKELDAKFGTQSKSNIKAPANILAKATRPSILAKKPWHGVEHIRDSFRFKTVLGDARDLPEIIADLETKLGATIIKRDVDKFLTPGMWGWRIVAFDLQMPNGQLLEYYLPVKELEYAKDEGGGHHLFENWRNHDLAKLTPEEKVAFNKDLEASNKLYQDAFDTWMKRYGATEDEIRAALNKVSASAAGNRAKSAVSSSGQTQPDSQVRPPSLDDARKSPSPTKTERGSSRDFAANIGSPPPQDSVSDFSYTEGGGAPFQGHHVVGDDTTIDAANFDKPIPARFAVVELSSIKPSHSYSTGQPSPLSGYPKNLQPRNYAAGSKEDLKVREMTRRMQVRYHLADAPDASNGSSVITPDGTVLNGNGRAMSLELAAHQGRFHLYKNALVKKAAGFGIDPTSFADMKHPVLVRVVDMDPNSEQAKKFASSGNVSPTESQSPIRTAASLARVIDSDLLDSMRLNDDTTFSEAVTHPSNGRAFREHLNALMPPSEQSRYFTPDGNLTEGGTELVRSMLLSKVLPVPLVERLGEAHKQLKKTIEGSIPQLLKVRRDHPHADLTPQLTEALQFKADNPTATTPGSIENLLAQGSLFGGKAATLSPAGRMMVDFLNENGDKPRVSRQKLAQFVTDLSAKGGLYGEHMPDTPTLAAEALGVQEREGAVFGPVEAPTEQPTEKEPVEPEAPASSPELHNAREKARANGNAPGGSETAEWPGTAPKREPGWRAPGTDSRTRDEKRADFEKEMADTGPASTSKAPHEMTRDEFVAADPEVQKRRAIHEATLKNQPQNADVSAESLASAEKSAEDRHRGHVATAPVPDEAKPPPPTTDPKAIERIRKELKDLWAGSDAAFDAGPSSIKKLEAKVAEVQEKLKQATAGTGFTGTTKDSVGRTYHWENGIRVPGPSEPAKEDAKAAKEEPKKGPHPLLGDVEPFINADPRRTNRKILGRVLGGFGNVDDLQKAVTGGQSVSDALHDIKPVAEPKLTTITEHPTFNVGALNDVIKFANSAGIDRITPENVKAISKHFRANFDTKGDDFIIAALKAGGAKDYPELAEKAKMSVPNPAEVPNNGGNQLESSGGPSQGGGVHPGIVGEDAPVGDRAGEPGSGAGNGVGLPQLPDREDAPSPEPERAAAGRGDAAGGRTKSGAPRTPRKRRQSGGPPRDDAGTRLGGGADGTEPALPNPTPAEQVVSEPPTPENPTDLSAGNFRYHDRDFFASGLKSKFNANMAAIRTLRDIQAEGRTTATPEEQAILSKFVGWGQFPGVFNDFRDGDFEGQDLEDWKAQLEAQGMDYDKWQEERGKWAKEREALHGLLSPEEWDAAKKSTLNAHYTHPDVVDAHWKIAQKLGFKGGKYLETSAGIGYYLGLMPQELAAKTRSTAVELDPTPGAMLKMLYPNVNTHIEGFEKHRAPDGFYDFIASNVPFGNYTLNEDKYNKFQARIHDHFFLKSADKVRPGGLVMHITSTGTLDKPDARIREELAKTCDLVGAIRFPGKAHKANAGTDVVTDMVILRKRLPGEEPGDQSWLQTAEVPDPLGGPPITVNKYFADHPEQILGRLDRSGTMYRKGGMNVTPGEDYHERLQAAIDRLPTNVMSSNRAPRTRFEPETLPAPGEVKIGGYHLQDGKLFVREGDGIVEQQQVSPAERTKIAAHLGVRDAMRAVINAETAGEDAEPARKELNKVYDAFVAKHGPLNDPKNRRVFGDDPDSPPLLALEKYDRKTKVATKADIFRKITVGAIAPVTHANNVAEGLGVSLHESGSLDIDRIAELTGHDKESVGKQLVEQGLAFNDPSDGWQPADHYLSGNVRRKLVMARAAAAVDPRYAANVAALEKVQPEDIHHEDIDARLGSPWIPASDIHQFCLKTLNANANGIKVRYEPSRAEWIAEYADNHAGYAAARSKAAREIWATSRADFMTLLNCAMNGKMPNFQRRVPGSEPPQYVQDKEENEACSAKIQELKDEFKNWVWTDDERRERLHRHYNDNFNNIRLLKYNGQHQKLPGMNPSFRENMHPHIKDFIWQVVTTGKGLAAHEVGTGKTTAMVASAMELRRLGLARKPALLCKKANVDAITKEALQLYPGAKILSTADMFTAEKRKLAASRIATGDYDMIIMTHDHMDALPMRPETMAKFIREELEEVSAAHAAAFAANPDKNDRIVKQLEDAKAKVEARLNEALNAKAKDDAVYFEDLGIDQLFVDEAHRYKSLPVYTKMSQLKGVPTGQSQRATSMYMRTQWLAERNKGRGTVFLTGTPISNTMPELFTMQRFLQPEDLRERGLNVFDAWAATFADVKTDLEKKATGRHEPTTRLSEFTNMPELMQLSRQIMDVVRADDLLREPQPGAAEEVPEDAKPKLANFTGSTYDEHDNKYAWKDGKLMEYVVKRPKKNKILNRSPKSDGIQRMMDDLAKRANDLKGQKPGQGEDNYLVITGDGRKGSIDLRLLYPEAPDDPDSKLNRLVDNVLKIHNGNPGKTQMIFSDTRESKNNPGFNVYTDVIEKLVKSGIPRDAIVDFSNLTERAREQAVQGLRDGTVRVAIGGTDTLGTGVNAQEHLLALHHLDVPYRPADLEQREGRAYRHGNKNKKIHIHNYVTEGSFDEMSWQILDRKNRFIREVIDTDPKNMKRRYKEEDTEELSYEQIMAAASGDPRILERVQLHDDIRKLENSATRHRREQENFASQLKQADTKAGGIQKRIVDYRETAKHLDAQAPFHLRIGSTEFKERGGALERFLASEGMSRKEYDALPDDKKKPLAERYAATAHVWDPAAALEKAQRESNGYSPIGEFRGLPIHHSGGWTSIRTLGGDTINTGTALKSIEYNANQMHDRAAEHERYLAQHHKDIQAIREKAGKEFPKAAELKKKQERLKQLESEMAAPEERADQPAIPGGESDRTDED